MKHLFVTRLPYLVMAALTLMGCANGGDSDESMSEIVSGALAGAANATETNGSFVAQARPLMERLGDLLAPIAPAFAAGQCPGLQSVGCDDNGDLVLVLDECNRGRAVWNGSINFDFSSKAVCEERLDVKGVPSSGSLVRTFGNPTTRTLGNRQVALDSDGGGVKVDFALQGDEPLRTVNVLGLGLEGKNLARDTVVFDVDIASDPAKPAKILGTGKDKQILEGKLIVDHNLAQFTAEAEIQEPLTFAAGCCHPVGGKVETTFSGSKSGSQVIQFQGTCGVATLVAEDGTESEIQLRHCF